MAFAPFHFFPILWLSFPALIFLLQGTKNDFTAFVTGWSFAFGCFVFSFYWISASMFVDIAHFWWAVPLSLVGLPIFFALYYGLAAIIMRRLGLDGLPGVLTFALLWFLADYARGHAFTGFPWDLEGYAWGSVLPVLQVTSLIGIYGLTLLTLIAASLPALLLQNMKRNQFILVGSLVILLVLGIWGAWRMGSGPMPTVENVRLRLVQPNTDQAHKWVIDELETHFQKLLDLTSAPSLKPITTVMWPETAAPFYLTEDEFHRRRMAKYVPDHGVIITGVVRRSPSAFGTLRYYNSLVAVDSKANIVAGYDKFHLVPYGEYIPLRPWLPLRTLANLGLDFTPGDGPHSLRVPNLPSFSPFICYEAIFPGDVIDAGDRPQFMLNVTNDGWYGHTTGPYQHFANVRVRAIEEGLPLVRAANNGISGVVDPYGRIVARLGLGKTGYIDSDLPQALPPTIFSKFGEVPLWIAFGLITLSLGIYRFRTKS